MGSNVFQGSRHSAAKYPNDRNKSGARDNSEDQSGKLEVPNILSKVFLGRQQQYVGVVLPTQIEFCHPEQKIPPVVVTDASVVVVVTIRPSQGFLHDPGVDFLDAWQLRLGRMRHRMDN